MTLPDCAGRWTDAKHNATAIKTNLLIIFFVNIRRAVQFSASRTYMTEKIKKVPWLSIKKFNLNDIIVSQLLRKKFFCRYLYFRHSFLPAGQLIVN